MRGSKFTKANRYQWLAEKYNFTPEQIASMSPAIQLVLCGVIDNTKTFPDMKAYQEWMMSK